MIEYEKTRKKGLDWLLEHLNDDGSFRANKPLLNCYPKAPLALLKAGRSEEAMKVLDYIKGAFLRNDGDFRACDEYKIEPSKVSFEWRLYLYHNAWFCLSALLNGRFDISKPGIDYMLAQQSSSNGGFYSNPTGGAYKGLTDIASTSSACQVLSYFGRETELLRAADYLVQTMERQKDAELLCLYTNEDGDPLIAIPEQAPGFYSVATDKPSQAFWAVGIASAILALVHILTGRSEYLGASRQYNDFLLRCHGDASTSFGCWKQCWACCLLFKITGESQFQDKAIQILEYLTGYQDEDGAWRYGKDMGIPEDDDGIVFNLTSELILWFYELPRYVL
jgi:hypothetical protein